jgi:dihydrofolate synthase/folylpolyglutamate synthase
MRYEGDRWRLDLPVPSLLGAHQILNAGTAVACLENLSGFALSPAALRQGLCQIDWPARLQHLQRGPLIEMLPAGWELWLDGGHNPAAGEVLGVVAAGWRDRPLDLVVGMLNTKDAAGFLAPLAPHARSLQAVTIPGEDNPLPAEAIVTAAASVGIAAREANSVEDALRDIVGGREAGGQAPGRVLICGSLHLAGIVLAENG